LPANLTCEHCTIQWKWHTANSWACDDDGECCTGCGMQEEFYGCADVSIESNGADESTVNPTTSTDENGPTNVPSEDVQAFCANYGSGIHPHPLDSTAYIHCGENANVVAAVYYCRDGFEYNNSVEGCDIPQY